MGVRRTIRRLRKSHKPIIIFLSVITFIFSQAEYQVATIPHSASELSLHNSLESINQKQNKLNTSLSFLQYPSQINLLNYSYNKLNLILLDYGTLKDKLDNEIFNAFNAYECIIKYNFNRNILDLFKLGGSIGGLFSKIETYSSYALLSNIQVNKLIDNSQISFALENIGFVIKSYTNNNLKLPLRSQLSITKKLKHHETSFGYNNIYNFNTDIIEHIISIQTNINDNVNLRLSNSNYRNNLLIDNYNSDFYYGLALGVSVQSKNKSIFDIGICNLGPSGYIYGLTINF